MNGNWVTNNVITLICVFLLVGVWFGYYLANAFLETDDHITVSSFIQDGLTSALGNPCTPSLNMCVVSCLKNNAICERTELMNCRECIPTVPNG